MAYFRNPQAFYDAVIGKGIDVDNFPIPKKNQCWDLKAYFCYKEQLKVDLYCNLTGYAGDLYKRRYEKGFDNYFEFFYPRHAKKGDWIYWDQHVAMVWDVDLQNDRVLCLGQNQSGHQYVDLKWYKLSTALGCMRYKRWIQAMSGWIKSNGKWYYFDKDGNKLTGIHKLKWSGGEDTFLFNSEGVMLTEWQLYKGKWYYFDPSSGAAVKGTHRLLWKGKEGTYYFDPETCVMQTGEIIMTLTFDASGALIGGAKA